MGSLFLYKKFSNIIGGIIAVFNLIRQKAILTDLGFLESIWNNARVNFLAKLKRRFNLWCM